MDELLRIANPGLSALIDLFDTRTWQRSTPYVNQGRVQHVDVVEDDNAHPGWLIDARVYGSDTLPYATGIDLGRDDQGQWWFQGRCTCPVGDRCKHQAALIGHLSRYRKDIVPSSAPASAVKSMTVFNVEALMAANAKLVAELKASQSPARPPVAAPAPVPPPQSGVLDRWWSLLTPPPPRPSSHVVLSESPVADNEVLLFTLVERHIPSTAAFASVALGGRRATVLKAKLGAKPGEPRKLGKLRALASDAWRVSQRSDDALFRAVAQWLWVQQALPGRSRGAYDELSDAPVQDQLGLTVLESAVRAGRVVAADEQGCPGPVWSWGEPRTLDWAWTTLPSGAWQLVAQVDGQGVSQVRPVPGPVSLYLDQIHWQVGTLDLQGLAHEQAARLLQAPAMPDDWLRTRAAQPEVRRVLPSLPDAVAQPVVRRIRDVAPVPVLHIDFDADQSEPRLTLAFDYAGQRGYWSGTESVQQFIDTPAGLVDLRRDVLREHAAVQQCAVLGCEPLPPLGATSAFEFWRLEGANAAQRQQRFGGWLADDFAAWREAGFVIETGEGWGAQVRPVDSLDVSLGDAGSGEPFDGLQSDAQAETAGDWLHLSMGFRVGDRRINLLPWVPQLVAQAHGAPGAALQAPERLWVHDAQGHWWGVPGAALQPWLAALVELVGERPAGAFQAETLELTRIEMLRLSAEAVAVDLPAGQRGAGALHDLLDASHHGEAHPTPDGVVADLRPYQRAGLAWLQALARQRLGGVLADDMGLGKTLQTIAHLVAEQRRGALDRPALIVAPTSLVGNWRRECSRFAPGLRVLVLHGLERRGRFDDIAHHDVVLTTYPLLPRDAEILIKQPWHAVVLDEAQTIKNAKTQAAQVVQLLQARHRICLSGTPMENHLGEIWSLFEFLLPGYLSSETRFKTLFRTPIEKQGDTQRLALLRRRLAPFMLRRTKDMVATELPPKVETVVRVQFDAPQANLYETIRLSTEQSVRDALAEKGLARSHIMVLDALLKLRQVCCDPRLVSIPQARKVKVSAKLDWLMQALPEMVQEGRRILLFSQFTSMLELIEERLKAAGLTWVKLTGQSPGHQRDALVERFTSGEVPIFLISLKAGGVGLNLPQADTVIHYDPWWNPAVEHQATDRAHRLGQTQTVFVYKLVAEDTLEERILALQERKAALAAGLHGAAGAGGVALTESDLAWLLQPLGAAVEAAETSLKLNLLENS